MEKLWLSLLASEEDARCSFACEIYDETSGFFLPLGHIAREKLVARDYGLDHVMSCELQQKHRV